MSFTPKAKLIAPAVAKASLTSCLLAIAGLAAPTLHAQENSGSSEWQFAATIYGWLPDVGGKTELPLGGGGSIDVDVSKILDHLKMTGMGSFEFSNGKWGLFTDLIYLSLGDSNSSTQNLSIGGVPIPATVTADTHFGLKSTIWSVAATYRAMASSDSTFDVLAGARLGHMKETLDWTFTGDFGQIAPPPLTGSQDASLDHWDAIVGGKGRVNFGTSHKWAMPYYFDVGAGDSDLTWQAEVALIYSFGWGDLGVAWRYLDYDLGSGPIKDLNFNGPAAGAIFRW